MTTAVTSNTYHNIKIAVFALCALVLLFLGMYAFLINQTVAHVVLRENTEQELSDLALAMGGLESAYMDAQNEITMDHAYRLGFVDATNVVFLTSVLREELSLNTE